MDDIRERMCNNYCGFGVKFGAGKDIACQHCPLNELPKWIPVAERLPDFNTDVLVSYNNGTVSLAQFIAAFSTGYWFNYDNACGSRKVIAWAPLPAPYVNEEPPTDGCFGCKHRIIRSVPTSKFYCNLDDAFHDNLINCPLEQDAPSASELRGEEYWADQGDEE